jgi:peroxiredoxin
MANMHIGDALIDFTLPATDGNSYTASDVLKIAKALIVVFTCNHCPYAQAWEGRLIQMVHEYDPQGVNMLAQYPADNFEHMTRRAIEKHYVFPYLFDESQEVARAYGAERTPELFIFDAAGKLRYHGAPDDNYEDEHAVEHHYAREALNAILADHDVALAETRSVGCTIKYRA